MHNSICPLCEDAHRDMNHHQTDLVENYLIVDVPVNNPLTSAVVAHHRQIQKRNQL